MSKLAFLMSYLRHPSRTGSVIPSSAFLSQKISQEIEKLLPCQIVELGGGTGAITRYIARYQPTIVEIDSQLAQLLAHDYPQCAVMNMCAMKFLRTCTFEYGCVISIPLINNPLRKELLTCFRNSYEAGHMKWCIIFTYGSSNPLKAVAFKKTQKVGSVLGNIPPANIWVYE